MCTKSEHGLEIQSHTHVTNGYPLMETQIELSTILEIQLKVRLSPLLMEIRLHVPFTLIFMISSLKQV